MPPAPPSRYGGLEGLYRADAVEVAAVAFVDVFAGATLGAPVPESHLIDEVVAWMAGAPPTGLLGTVDATTWQLLQPSVLESVYLWERGEGVLGSPDPVRKLRELLDGVELH